MALAIRQSFQLTRITETLVGGYAEESTGYMGHRTAAIAGIDCGIKMPKLRTGLKSLMHQRGTLVSLVLRSTMYHSEDHREQHGGFTLEIQALEWGFQCSVRDPVGQTTVSPIS